MSDDDDPIRRRIAILTDAELRAALGPERDQWQPEALEIAREELGRRSAALEVAGQASALTVAGQARALAARTVPVGLAGARWVDVTCDHCAVEWRCRTDLVATGDQERPIVAADAGAPCPCCGHYQRAAVERMRARHHEWKASAGVIALLIGGAGAFVGWGIALLIAPSAEATIVAAACTAVAAGGIGLLASRLRAQRRFDPNADAAARVQLEGTEASQALTRERYDQLARGEQIKRPQATPSEGVRRLRVACELLGQALTQSKRRDPLEIADAAALAELAETEVAQACVALGLSAPPAEPQPKLPGAFRASVLVLIAELRLATLRGWMKRKLARVEKLLAELEAPAASPYR
jgi:hypothetical protein